MMHFFRCAATMGLVAVALLSTEAVADSVSREEAEAAATRFGAAIVESGGFSFDQFEGGVRETFQPLLSRKLTAELDNIHNCGRDWASHQPPDSTDKPPFIDCCVFSGSSDWSPNSFAIQNSAPVSDGRRRVVIEYRYDSPSERSRWPVAVYVVGEEGRYVIDDFEGGLGQRDSWFVTTGSPHCRDGKWITGY